jgi:type IV secretion system protein VirB10
MNDMTAILSERESNTAAAAPDPHAAPKLSPDDPRLRLRRNGGRTLRAGPLVALAVALSGAVVLAAALAFETPSHTPQNRETSAASATVAPPMVPDAIRNASPPPPAASFGRPDASPPRELPDDRSARGASNEERLRQEQGLHAEMAPILFAVAAGGGDESRPTAADARGAALGPNAPLPQPSATDTDTDPNLQGRKNAFVDGQGVAKASGYAAIGVQHPRSPYELQAGTILPAVLITAINSDLPGPVVGQIRENVYDTVTGNTLLVPQGARLLASYDSMVAWGQERVLLCWNRLIFPNGDSIDLPCMPAADLEGAAGLTDSVDEHWFRIVKGAAVASLLAATTQGIAGSPTGFTPTVPQVWASNAAGEINQVGQQLTRRDLNVQPTITVRPGYSVNVMVTRDLVIPPYRDPASPSGARR